MKFEIGQKVYVRLLSGQSSIETITKIGRLWGYINTGSWEYKFDLETGALEGVGGTVYENEQAFKDADYLRRVCSAFRHGLRGCYKFPDLSVERMIAIAAELGFTIDVPKEAA